MFQPPFQPAPAERDPAFTMKPKSSFGIRFHQTGVPKVYFRTEPDLTSDPNQVWVPLDTSEIKFENYNQDYLPQGLDATTPQEEKLGNDEPSPKRQKIEATMPSKICRPSPMTMGFRVDKPLKATVCDDIWRSILKESHPTVLLIAKNLNHRFHALLQEQSIWRASRINLHGGKMPGPPGELTEQRYAHLLYGQGCDFQKSKCGSHTTKKVYWPFLLRMCDTCFRRKTEKVGCVLAALLYTLCAKRSPSRTKTYEVPRLKERRTRTYLN